MQIALVLSLLILAIVLLATEKLPVDVITLLLLVALVGSGVLTTAEAFAGFSRDIIIILASIFVISAALQEVGILDSIGERLVRLGQAGPKRLLVLIMASAAALSAFMNNTTVAATLVPPVIGMARTAGMSASRLLMPLAFASILGGTCTLIGTSTNVAVSGFIAASGLQPLAFFEIAPVGLVIVCVGIAYMALIGYRLLPDRKEQSPSVTYALREYLSEIVVLPNSPLIGQTTNESDLAGLDLRILSVIRGKEHLDPATAVEIAEEDMLLVEGHLEMLMGVKREEGVEIRGKLDLEKLQAGSPASKLAEVLVAPESSLVGRTLRKSRFSERNGLPVLAIHRHGESLHEKLGDVPLQPGDLLLVEGPANRIDLLRDNSGLVVIDEHPLPSRDTTKGLYVAGAFIAAIVVGSLGWLPLPIAFLSAALATVLMRCISVQQARASVDLRLLLLIGGMTAFGTAMEKTGAAALLAEWVVAALSPLGVMAVMAGFFVLTIALTQPMSNAAAALVVLPVAMNAARVMEVSERTFGVAIMLAASISFITPFEPACILVYGPGRYRFLDFVKVGGGLTLILIPLVLLLIPILWPLQPR